MSSSQVSLPSPKPFPWDSQEQTIRLVTSPDPTPKSDYQSALDYFEGAGRRFSYGLNPSDFESLDSIAIPSVENHADDERSSVEDFSLTSDGPRLRSDEVSPQARGCLHKVQRPDMSNDTDEVAEEGAETPNLVDGATMLPRSVNAMVRHQMIKSVENSPIFANTFERKRFIDLLKEPTTRSESVDHASVETMSVLGFLNSQPCPPESSLGRSISGSSETEFTENGIGSSGRGGDTSVTEETSVEEVLARVPTSYPTKVERPSAMEFGSFADWSRDAKHDIRAYQELVKSQEQQGKKKGLFNRAHNLLRRLKWRK
ncbi:hypothetical protein D9619_009686 [Psilocybe cf. subviscida]|uniref:Uncharacterized protein n=1 Tax=Psilocybe cf. subviscida TaxID=2480587 RepID=A0A8H5BLY9_9AGAR|nr:hypothetical protein D9619_009686 [Psilocybe cf. subviscida]